MKRTEFLQSLFNGSKKLFAAIFDWKPQFSKSLHLASMPDFQRVNMEICCFREQQPSNNPSKVADASAICGFSSSTRCLSVPLPFGTSVRKFWMEQTALEWLFRNHWESNNERSANLADLACQ